MLMMLIYDDEVRNMPETAVLLLAYIRGRKNEDATNIPVRRETDPEVIEMAKYGWHRITGKEIERDLGMGPWKYVKYLKWLVKAKYIKTKQHGLPAKRWITLLKRT